MVREWMTWDIDGTLVVIMMVQNVMTGYTCSLMGLILWYGM